MYDLNPVYILGPTNIPDRLRNAMHVQTRDHRAPDFVETFAAALLYTKKVFDVFGITSSEIIMSLSSGTGGGEAAICNTLSPGDKFVRQLKSKM